MESNEPLELAVNVVAPLCIALLNASTTDIGVGVAVGGT